MLKIALVTDTFYPQLNGVANAVNTIATNLRKKGHKVHIFAPGVRGYKEKNKDITRFLSFKVPFFPEELRLPIPIPYKNIWQLLTTDADLIHAHGNSFFSLVGLFVARMRRKPYLLTFHTLWSEYTHYVLRGKVIKPSHVGFLFKLYSALCDEVITPSEKMRAELVKYGVSKAIHVIPNSVLLSRFENIKTKDYLYKRLHIPTTSPILLSVGRLGKEKNFGFVLEVFKEVSKTNTDTQLVIIGIGPEEKRLRRRVEELILQDRVHFTGRVDPKEMPLAYASASIFVFASVTEVHPLVILEAAAAGLPFVVVDDKAFQNAVIPGVNGYSLVLKKEIFAEKINKLLNDPELCKQFGQASKRIIKENFHEDTLLEKLIDVYHKSLKDKHIFFEK